MMEAGIAPCGASRRLYGWMHSRLRPVVLHSRHVARDQAEVGGAGRWRVSSTMDLGMTSCLPEASAPLSCVMSASASACEVWGKRHEEDATVP